MVWVLKCSSKLLFPFCSIGIAVPFSYLWSGGCQLFKDVANDFIVGGGALLWQQGHQGIADSKLVLVEIVVGAVKVCKRFEGSHYFLAMPLDKIE